MDILSKYLEDISFISWVFEPTPELESFWKQYEAENPEEIKNIIMARKIVNQFRSEVKSLSEEEKILLFSRVLKEIERKNKSGKIKKIILEFSKYAAVAIIFFAVGALFFYRPVNINQAFQAFNANELKLENNAQLLRSNGESLVLNEKRSLITHQKTGDLIVNNDTIKPNTTNSNKTVGFNQLIIPYGKTSEIILPDGTKVFLNAGSRLAYPDKFTGDSREVMLIGEAFFDIMHDSKKPFIVQLSDMKIMVLGTKFNVSAYSNDGRIETALAEGKISIKLNNAGFFSSNTELLPGQLASFDRQSNLITVKNVKVEDYMIWTQGIMRFESIELNRIVKRLERYYNIQFSFGDPMLGNILISGKLGLNDNKEEVIERIARTASVNIKFRGENYYRITK